MPRTLIGENYIEKSVQRLYTKVEFWVAQYYHISELHKCILNSMLVIFSCFVYSCTWKTLVIGNLLYWGDIIVAVGKAQVIVHKKPKVGNIIQIPLLIDILECAIIAKNNLNVYWI